MINKEVFIFSESASSYSINNKKINSIESNNTEDLCVYLNEEELILDSDFILEEDSIQLVDNEFKTGDKILVIDSISPVIKKIISKNPRDITSNFKVFSSDVKFKFNHNYNISLRYKDEMLTSNFLTKFNPSLVPVSKIRYDVGSFLDETPNEVIARVIYNNSKYALELLESLEDDSDSSGSSSEEETKIPTYVKNYVRYRTDIDLCNAAYLTLSGKAGSASKSIGNISITNEVKIPYLKDLLKKFEELLKPNEDRMNGIGVKAAAFVKAKDTEYPLNSRVSF